MQSHGEAIPARDNGTKPQNKNTANPRTTRVRAPREPKGIQ